MFDRVILIDKPASMTSFGVVARIRRVLSQQAGHKVKVGHTGTLDPFATGLMIIVTGKECRNAQVYSKLDKVYEVEAKLGETSTTGDPEGDITSISSTAVTREELLEVLAAHVGTHLQTPPSFSAIKVNGQRAYKLAREGVEVMLEARPVTIYSLTLLDYQYPIFRFQVHVSSGTYIRSLVEDIGKELGVGAYTFELRRTNVSSYSINDAMRLEEFMNV